jgi:hypothetical protein
MVLAEFHVEVVREGIHPPQLTSSSYREVISLE